MKSIRPFSLRAASLCGASFYGVSLCGLLVGGALLKCQTAESVAQLGNSAAATSADVVQSLPQFELRADTENVLLTWLSDDGDFHVSESIEAVPSAQRSVVRVVQTQQLSGSGTTVYVADLTTPGPNGVYPIKTMSRIAWNALGATKREKRLEAFAPNARPAPADKPPSDAKALPLAAIVYGADWCKPCHQAEAYLKTLGVQVTKKNIEKSRAAQAEMREKLARIRRSSAGIPVIDLMGSIFIGFSKASLKQAVDQARKNASNTG